MFKVRLKFSKSEYSAYISHLDLMKTLQRSLIRAWLPVKYSSGFNPHMYLSILVPLSTGYQSECDLCDFELTTDTAPDNLVEMVNAALPHGLHAIEFCESTRAINEIAFCRYEIQYASEFSEKAASIFVPEVKILKHSKRGDREVILNDYISEIAFSRSGDGCLYCSCVLKAGDDPLNPSYITDVLRFHNIVSSDDRPLYVRKALLDKNCKDFF